MSVNKFGAPLHGTADATADTCDNDQRMETIRSLNLYVANYVRENALCLTNDQRSTFDATERKIRRVAHPAEDTDAATKRYVDDMKRTVGRALDTMEEDTYESTTRRLDAFTTAINTAMDKRLRDLEKSINIAMQQRFEHFDDKLVELTTPVV